MSASSSAASSALTRPTRTGLIFVGTLTALCLLYCYQTINAFESTTSNTERTGLRRSNAVHRRRRRQTNEENIDEGQRGPSDESVPQISIEGDDLPREIISIPIDDGETVIDDPTNEDWNWDDESPAQRNGQNIVQLLFRVSEDATRRNAYVHRGCQCNSCGTVPIRGVRYRCSNCADFDLCEACEAQGLHIKTHIFYKVRVPTTGFGSRQTQPVWYPGDPDSCMKVLPRDMITKLSKETGFERPELDAYWEQWTFMANTEWREDPDDLLLAMDRKTFDQCLIPFGGNRAPTLIHDRMFAFYDQNNDDLISFPEFLGGLAHRRKKDKLKRVFEGYDINGDGYVDRKDFLRLFRSYYVLYKQMHRDTLGGLDSRLMNSTDAHQLVTSRQPLSGGFGRDGRFPPAPDPRTGEGKTPGINGDLEVIDGKGVISESGNDFGNKQDVLIESVMREHFRDRPPLDNPWSPTRGNTYWRAVIDPPQTRTELQHHVLDGLIRERRGEIVEQANDLPAPPASSTADYDSEDELDSLEEQSAIRYFIRDEHWPPEFVRLEHIQAVCGQDATFETMERQSRTAVLVRARAGESLCAMRIDQQTAVVNDEIHARWKRRHFYTDEEEGASAPADWKDEEDIPIFNGKAAESSKEGNTRPLSPRSRSSSKVRFADDDDYDTRSNASTSSRSIPERWGGMEIPEAEKDAGKEILYQVTQQAFNELLDPLFKKREDFAVAALTSKDVRNTYRHLFMDANFEKWAAEMESPLSKWIVDSPELKLWRARPTIPEVEPPDIRQRYLDELRQVLSESDPALQIAETLFSHHQEPESPDCTSFGQTKLAEYRDPTFPQFRPDKVVGLETSSIVHSDEAASPPFLPQHTDETDVPSVGPGPTGSDLTLLPRNPSAPLAPQLNIIPLASSPQTPASSMPNHDGSSIVSPPSSPIIPLTPDAQASSREFSQSLDSIPEGLLRQFNPLSSDKKSHQMQTNETLQKVELFDKIHFIASKINALLAIPIELRQKFLNCDWMALFKLRELERIEKEAEERGGWGRVNWEEFESMIKGEAWGELGAREGGKNPKVVMDYLGSWIDYCIP